VFDPADHGAGPGLPAIAVEDVSADDMDTSGQDVGGEEGGRPMVHTARPPVELME